MTIMLSLHISQYSIHTYIDQLKASFIVELFGPEIYGSLSAVPNKSQAQNQITYYQLLILIRVILDT